MVRPTTTTIATSSHHFTKEEKAVKYGVEDTLKGNNLSPTPPRRLTPGQKKVYKWLYANLEPSNILSSLDVETMCNASIIIERLQIIDDEINKDTDNIYAKSLLEARRTYFAMYLKICSELCLSPASRAKMGSLALNEHKKKKDPLLKALEGGFDD